MTRIIRSRNQREGRYAGWRVTGGRNRLNWNCRQINHERTGGSAYPKAWSLKSRSNRPW
ncbi:hypothetical protein [Massilia varians]|uniref:hypothetical protein n=1 Tax=Massilia varians TaxID=457921 RepID=UPI00255253A2|nr:hypothetical protein [Massilia varians]MDK6077923.1 hypothetical protein [Massilia varians]